MGKNDKVLKEYFRDRERFADLFNGVFFAGKTVVRAADLEELSGEYIQPCNTAGKNAAGGRNAGGLYRDIVMRLKSGGTLKLLAVENQTKVDYTMPLRCMQYDALEYGKQLKELKKQNKEQGGFATAGEFLCGVHKGDRLAPIYTLCVYYGEDPWDGPESLCEMMDFGEDRDGMSRFFSDYPLHLYCVNEKQDYTRFHTEIRRLFQALQYRRDKKGLLALVEKNEEYRHVDMETLEVMSVLLDIPRLWENREKYKMENGEEGNMCQAIRELMEDARNEGMEQGQLLLLKCLIEDGTLTWEQAADRMKMQIAELEKAMKEKVEYVSN